MQTKRVRIIKLSFQIILFVILLLFTALFVAEFSTRYSLNYNEMGRYFDATESIVYHEQSIPFYGFGSLVLFLALIFHVRWIVRTVRKTA